MPPRQPTTKEVAIRERNRANAQKSTGPRTAAGKKRSAMNALTHGLRAESPSDAADIADRTARAQLLAATFAPEDAFETMLLHRMASALQRLEKADHLESQAFDAAIRINNTTPGSVVSYQKHVRSGFVAINRYRATAQVELFNTYRMLEVYRQPKTRSETRADTPVLPNEP